MNTRILIVDDELAIQKALVKFLASQGYDVEGASDGAEAIEKAKNQFFDLVITDLKMPSMSGIDLIKRLKAIHGRLIPLVMTGFGTIDSAVEAIKAGAFHYLTKPFELDDVLLLVQKAIRYRQLEDDNERLLRQVRGKYSFENIIGCSDRIREVFQLLEKVAETDSPVLLSGEVGTGKELVARSVHFNSRRSHQPLVAVNCGAIPADQLESELFGYVKGAFPGALQSKVGRIEAAHGGTLFLDEIDQLSPALQVKLLRVLQEKRFEPLGSMQSMEVDIRVLAASAQNLGEWVEQNRFREDLYYRLNVVSLRMPALRDRICDIPLLIEHFLDTYSRSNQVQRPVMTDAVMNILLNYKWPGNVRELENTMERLVVLKPGQSVEPDDLADKFTQMSQGSFFKSSFNIPDAGISLKNVVDEFENTLIYKALDKTNWNKNRAAHLLHLNRTTLVEKIKKKNLEKPKESGKGASTSGSNVN